MKSALTFLSVLLLATILSNSSFAQDAVKGKALFAVCIQCHGADANGLPEKKAPRLSGQHDWYLVKQLTEIKSGVRKNLVMQPYVAKLTEQDFKDLAAYITTL
ncbi:MAG: cytochrome c [Bacteriovorax sp.]|nr:cytochrome c [Bacteriovorax sp.]